MSEAVSEAPVLNVSTEISAAHSHLARRMLRNPLGLLALAVLALIVLAAIVVAIALNALLWFETRFNLKPLTADFEVMGANAERFYSLKVLAHGPAA